MKKNRFQGACLVACVFFGFILDMSMNYVDVGASIVQLNKLRGRWNFYRPAK